jgi:hypothetical protein
LQFARKRQGPVKGLVRFQTGPGAGEATEFFFGLISLDLVRSPLILVQAPQNAFNGSLAWGGTTAPHPGTSDWQGWFVL